MTNPLIIPQTTKAQAICPYCGVGCRLWMESAYGELIRVKGVVDWTDDCRRSRVATPGCRVAAGPEDVAPRSHWPVVLA